MDPDHSLLLPYRMSDVEVFDYQLEGLRTEFIRSSSLNCRFAFFVIASHITFSIQFVAVCTLLILYS